MKTKEEIEQLANEYANGKSSSDVFKDAHKNDFIKGYTQCQEDIIKEIDNLKSQLRDEAKEPKYAVKGDYCAVCRGTEFWNDEEE